MDGLAKIIDSLWLATQALLLALAGMVIIIHSPRGLSPALAASNVWGAQPIAPLSEERH